MRRDWTASAAMAPPTAWTIKLMRSPVQKMIVYHRGEMRLY